MANKHTQNSLPRWALALFDSDGCTSVVRTSCLCTEGLQVCAGIQCTLEMGRTVYTVEILKLADVKGDLNSFENAWENSGRSEAIARQKDAGMTDGYLSVQPTETEEDIDANESFPSLFNSTMPEIKTPTHIPGKEDIKEELRVIYERQDLILANTTKILEYMSGLDKLLTYKVAKKSSAYKRMHGSDIASTATKPKTIVTKESTTVVEAQKTHLPQEFEIEPQSAQLNIRDESPPNPFPIHLPREQPPAHEFTKDSETNTPPVDFAPRECSTIPDSAPTTPDSAPTSPDSAPTSPDSAPTSPDSAPTPPDFDHSDSAASPPDSAASLPDSAPSPQDSSPTPTDSVPPTFPETINVAQHLLMTPASQVNIGPARNMILVDSVKFKKSCQLPTPVRFILATMELVYTNDEMSTSNIDGGVIKYGGNTLKKNKLSEPKLTAIYRQAATIYGINEDVLRASTSIRNAINAKCRAKRQAVVRGQLLL